MGQTLLDRDRARHLLNEALKIWDALLGLDPEKTDGSITFRQYDLVQQRNRVVEAMAQDATYISSALLMKECLADNFREMRFTVEDLVDEKPAVIAFLANAQVARTKVNQACEFAGVDAFKERVGEMVRAAGGEPEVLQEFLSDVGLLGQLRASALNALTTLRVDQFVDGEPGQGDPVYNRFIHEFPDMEALVAAAWAGPNALTVNLVRNREDAYQSFFAITARNGQRLFVFSDLERPRPGENPLRMEMSRRKDRRLAERADSHWFPYDLMGVESSADGTGLVPERSHGDALVLAENKIRPLTELSRLEPSSLVWLAMVLESIYDRVWIQQWKAEAPSYIARSILPIALPGHMASDVHLPAVVDRDSRFAALELDDVTAEAFAQGDGVRAPTGCNRWLEDRYAGSFTEEDLNVTQEGDQLLLAMGSQSRLLSNGGGEPGEGNGNKRHLSVDAQRRGLAVNSFGHRKDLDANRRFFARWNLALRVNAAAQAEFARREKEVVQWYAQQVQSRAEILVTELLSKGTLYRFSEPYGSGFGGLPFPGMGVRREVTAAEVPAELGEVPAWARIGKKDDGDDQASDSADKVCLREFGLLMDAGPNMDGTKAYAAVRVVGSFMGARPSCFATGAASSHVALFYVRTPEDIAHVCGCSVDDLPDVLRHRTLLSDYTGNSILQRVDPMESMVKDPWQKLNLSVAIWFSKSVARRLRKSFGK